MVRRAARGWVKVVVTGSSGGAWSWRRRWVGIGRCRCGRSQRGAGQPPGREPAAPQRRRRRVTGHSRPRRSVPMPTPCRIEVSHSRYADWCSARQARWRSRCRSRLGHDDHDQQVERRPRRGRARRARRYAVNGTTACHQRMSTNSSTTAVTTCDGHASGRRAARGCGGRPGSRTAARAVPAGRRGRAHPSTVVTVSSTSATTPVPRLRYQRTGSSVMTPSAAGRRRLRARLAVVTTRPRRRLRAGRPRPGREPARGPRRPGPPPRWLAVLAATQVGPVAVTVRHTSSAGRPVRGSSRWWRATPPWLHRRTRVLEVARPPCVRSDPLAARCRPGRSDTAIVPGLAVGGGDPDVAAHADQRRLAELGLDRGSRSGRPPTPCRWSRGPGRCPPGPGSRRVGSSRIRARRRSAARRRRSGRRGARSRSAGESGAEVAVVAQLHEGPAEQRVDQSVGAARPPRRRRRPRRPAAGRRRPSDPAPRWPGSGRSRRGTGCRWRRRRRPPPRRARRAAASAVGAAYGQEQVGARTRRARAWVRHGGHDPLLGAGAPACGSGRRGPEDPDGPDDPDGPLTSPEEPDEPRGHRAGRRCRPGRG